VNALFKYMEDFCHEQLSRWEIENNLATKICSQCGIEKTKSNYPRHIKYKDNLDSRCKECIKIHADIRNKLHPIAPEKPEFCECCGKAAKLFLDHDHETLEIRGWICDYCNMSIGRLGDNASGLRKALTYLESCKKAYNTRNVWIVKQDSG
jgi:hypothetical protein